MLLLKEGRVGAAVWRSRCSVSCQWVDEWWWRCKDGEEVSGRVTERAGLAGLADARMAKSCISLILRLCCAEQTGKQQTWRASRQLQTHQRTNGRAGGRAGGRRQQQSQQSQPSQPSQPPAFAKEFQKPRRGKKNQKRGEKRKKENGELSGPQQCSAGPLVFPADPIICDPVASCQCPDEIVSCESVLLSDMFWQQPHTMLILI